MLWERVPGDHEKSNSCRPTDPNHFRNVFSRRILRQKLCWDVHTTIPTSPIQVRPVSATFIIVLPNKAWLKPIPSGISSLPDFIIFRASNNTRWPPVEAQISWSWEMWARSWSSIGTTTPSGHRADEQFGSRISGAPLMRKSKSSSLNSAARGPRAEWMNSRDFSPASALNKRIWSQNYNEGN